MHEYDTHSGGRREATTRASPGATRSHLARPRVLTVGVAAASVVAMQAARVEPALPVAYHSVAAHAAIETAASIVASIGAFLVFGRLRDRGLLSDLLLICGLTVIAGTNLLFGVVPLVLRDAHEATTAAIGGQLLGSIYLASGAVVATVREREVRPFLRTIDRRFTAVLAAGLGAIIAALAWVPTPSPPAGTPTAAQAVAAVAFFVAAFGFTACAERTGDELTSWLGIAAVLAGFARIAYATEPTPLGMRLTTGDAFRLLFAVAVLTGAGREVVRFWRERTERAVAEERRRIARDLHDGMAQDLAFIARNARGTGGAPAEGAALASAAERALQESRRAIAALSGPHGERLDEALAHATGQVAARTGTRLVLDLDPRAEVGRPQLEELVRIAAEAVSNACRHGGADVVRIRLSTAAGIVLDVTDAGAGFDPATAPRSVDGHFGLTSMAERAERLDAELSVRSRPGIGTRVRVRLA